MKKRFWTITEAMEICEVDEGFLRELEQEELVCPVTRKNSPGRLISDKDIENLRLAKILIEEMGVNLAGVEVILRMRETIYQMRSQFDDILEDLAGHIRQKFRE
jgi:MerR family transcriptional regulator, heat shock protein HspR